MLISRCFGVDHLGNHGSSNMTDVDNEKLCLDAPGLSDPAHIESIQEKAQCAMEEYVR